MINGAENTRSSLSLGGAHPHGAGIRSSPGPQHVPQPHNGVAGSASPWFIITALSLHHVLWAVGHAVNKHIYLLYILKHKGKILDISIVRFIMV